MIPRLLRGLGIAALLIAYALLAHYSNDPARDPALGATISITPLLLIALVFAWRSTHRLILLAVVALAVGLMLAAWPLLKSHFGLIYWLQNVGLYLILFATFGRTLLAGRQPLCTRFAETLYGPVSPLHARYTRLVTISWTLFFAVMAQISTLLFFFAPLADWSIFANFLTLPLVGLMFLVEYLIRRRVMPDSGHMRFFDAIRAYREDTQNRAKDDAKRDAASR